MRKMFCDTIFCKDYGVKKMKQIDEKSMKTLEYYKIIDQLSEFTFYDVRPHLKRMEIGAVLSRQELIQIGQLLKGVREIFDFFQEVKEEEIALNHLYSVSDEMIVLKKVEQKIFATLTEGGGVVDDA